jgi:hypothetical protein
LTAYWKDTEVPEGAPPTKAVRVTGTPSFTHDELAVKVRGRELFVLDAAVVVVAVDTLTANDTVGLVARTVPLEL